MKKLSTILVMTGLMLLSSAQNVYAQKEQNLKSAKGIIDSIDWKQTPMPGGMVTINVECNDGQVALTNNGNAEVKAGTLVKWNITCPYVKSIQIIPGSKGYFQHSDIWEVEPEPLGAKSWIGQTKLLGQEDPNITYGFYSVIWFDQFNTPYVIDPLIRVNK